MTTSRDTFLQRVRQAAAEGNRVGTTPSLEPRGTVGYQGAGPDPVARFAEQLAAAGGFPHVAPDRATALRTVMDLVQRRPVDRILLGEGAALDALDLRRHLSEAGLQVTHVSSLNVSSSRDPFFASDIGISGVAYLVAETGSVVVASRPEEPRSLSLLPPVHLAIAERRQLLPDLFDLFETLGNGAPLPSCLSLITGPSKTGDIELRLVTGVHGPGELHVIVVNA